MQLGTNYLGHFLLFWLLKDALLNASTPQFNSRVVNVSSSGHHSSEIIFDDLNLIKEGSYEGSAAYGQSKLAQIYQANYIDRNFGPKGLHALSLMPGGIRTNLQKHFDADVVKSWDTNEAVSNFMKSPEQGAATTIVAAVSKEWEGRGGKYLEDCREALFEPFGFNFTGVKDYAYDVAKEDRLWKLTLELLGLE